MRTALRLVIGPPGTGKTSYVTARAREAADRYGEQSVIICSLSRAAAAEAASRGAIPARQARTMHSFCFELLGRPLIAETSRELTQAWNERYPQFRLSRSNEEHDDFFAARDESLGDRLFRAVSAYRARMVPVERWDYSWMRDFYEKRQAFLAAHDACDFDDLIHACIERKLGPPCEAEYVYLDEAQDSSAAEQYLIRHAWAPHLRGIVIVGDPDQSIYRFRGGDATEMFRGVPDEHVHVLSQSYRLPRRICDWVQRWIAKCDGRRAIKYCPRDAEGAIRTLTVRDVCSKHCVADVLVHDIERQLHAGRSCMIVASCSYMLDPILAALRDAGVPFQNAFRPKNGKWNPLAKRRGVSVGERILAFLDPHWRGGWTARALKLWSELVVGMFRRGMRQAIDSEYAAGEQDRVLTEPEVARYFAREEVFRQALAAARRLDVRWLYAWLTASAARRRHIEYVLNIVTQRGIESLTERPRLSIGTIHSVKGGEADCCYLLPTLSLRAYRHIGQSREGHSDMLRLFYVGATRAREELVLVETTARHGGRVQWLPIS